MNLQLLDLFAQCGALEFHLRKEQLKRAKREVAAWLLAYELGIDRFVPATVLRKVPALPDATTMVCGSVQVLWPRFRTALDGAVSRSVGA
jgi:hypothetical protein